MQLVATARHRLPDLLAQNPANLLKSVLPPAQECQIAHLGTLATLLEPKWHQGLAADTRSGQRPPKCYSNASQICHQASKKTSIQASKHPSLASQRSAAEAVAFSIYIYIYVYMLYQGEKGNREKDRYTATNIERGNELHHIIAIM